MKQELGETTEEMMKSDDQAVQDILNARPSGHYWIVIHHKPTKMHLDTGESVLIRHVKAYNVQPKALMGTVILEVENGEILDHTVSPHDAPIDWGAIEKHAGRVDTPGVFEAHPISGAYVYNE